MQRSSERILTTHVGSLPRPPDLLEAVSAMEQGEPVDEAAHAARLRGAVREIVRKQVELGIDVIDDGEFGKPSFVSYVNERLGGFEPDREGRRGSPWADSREARSFPEFYAEGLASARHNRMVCTGPVSYRGRAQLQRDIDNLKAALDGATPAEAFMPAISPTSAADWQRNAYYATEEEYLFAIAEALRAEYEAIVQAGFLLQVDDPHLVTYWVKQPGLTLAQCRTWAELRVEALNHALRNIPAGPYPPSHLLRHQHGAAHPRHGAEGHRRHHLENPCRRLFVRGRQSAPRARVEAVGDREAAGGQDR